ncbi:hypothetical protein [Bradyrhizobium pachyrhizi]|uniref:hypothetical protein n=1 Tax=Bradyrhizobium pachyrhizi TaxID=280333 RepID=UPI001FDA1540|nr:hypothetical protein [Bradyrhizobium pachyrhizi]
MALHFSRVNTGDLEIWIASSDDYSFVICNESRSGAGLHGEPGFVASYRPDFVNMPAAQVAGSPFSTLLKPSAPAMRFWVVSLLRDDYPRLERGLKGKKIDGCSQDRDWMVGATPLAHRFGCITGDRRANWACDES